MAEPTLGEIQSYTGNAGLGLGASGGSDVVVAPDYAAQYINQAAQAKAAADKFTYQEFQKNLQDHMTNFNAMDVTGLMNSDYEPLGKKYRDLSKLIVDNYDIIRNPNKNLAKYSEITQAENSLRTELAQSKMQKVIADKNREFLAQHPSWNTPVNQQTLTDFETKPMDQRQLFNFGAPKIIDPVALGKTIADNAKAAYAKAVTDGKYISEEKGINYNDEVWKQEALKALYQNDEFGQSVKSNWESTYNNIPAEEKAKYNGFEDFYLKTIPKPQDAVLDKSIAADPYGTIATQFNNNKTLNDINFRHDLTKMAKQFQYDMALQKLKDEMKLQTDLDKGQFINTETAKIFENGHTSNKSYSSTAFGSGQENEINNISPKYAQLFGYKLDTKLEGMPTGKSEWIVPDKFTMTPDGNLRPIFYLRDEAGNVINARRGTEKKDQAPLGPPRVDGERSKAYSPDQVRATLATITTSSNIDDVLAASNKQLLNTIGSESLDGANLKQYTAVKGLGGNKATQQGNGSGIKSITLSKEKLAHPELQIYTLPNGDKKSLKELLDVKDKSGKPYYTPEKIEEYLNSGVLK